MDAFIESFQPHPDVCPDRQSQFPRRSKRGEEGSGILVPAKNMEVSDSLLRQPRFWVFQVAGWLVIKLLTRGYDLADIVHVYGGTWLDAGLTLLTTVSLSVCCSCALAWVFLRLPERWLLGRRAIPVVIGLSVLVTVFYSLGMHLYFVNASWIHQPLWDLEVVVRHWWRSSVLLIAWSSFFLMMVLSQRVQKERERSLKAEALSHEAQLQALRAQLNPHFLFNAITSVVALVKLDPDRARRMMLDVARLLRRALDATQTESVTLREELDFILRYLRCEQVRFQDRMSVAVRVPDELLDQPVPSMLLQPLVENAVKHGLVGTNPLCLRVTGYSHVGRLVIEIHNSGRLRLTEIGGDNGRGTDGAGLRIVRQRLAVRYPESGSLELLAEDGWVIARVAYDPDESVMASEVGATEPLAVWR